MIFISFLFLVAMALPLLLKIVTLNLKKEIFGISPIILLDATVCIYTALDSVIGYGIGIYSGLFLSGIRDFNLYNFSFIVLQDLSVFVVHFLLMLFNLYYLDSFIFNPLNYLGFDLGIFVFGDLDIVTYPHYLTLLPIFAVNNFKNIYNLKFMSTKTVNYDLDSNYETSSMNKDLSKIIGGGYLSYKNIESIGFVIDLLDNKPDLIMKLDKYLDILDINKTYTVLPVIRWINEDTGLSNSITVYESLKIHKFVNKNLLAEKISDAMRKALYRYNVIQNNSEFILMYREWLDIKDFNLKEKDFSSITNTLDNLLSKKKSNINNQDLIQERLNSIENDKYSNILMDNYGTPISNNGITTDYTLNNDQYLSVKYDSNNTNIITVKNFDNSDNNLINWTDTKTDFGFIRLKDFVKYFYNKNGEIFKTEGTYNFLDYPVDNINEELDVKIGSIDFETFGNEGIGIQNVYAAGWAINDAFNTKKFYYIEKDGNSLDLVKNMIFDLANNKQIDGYTFYAHNLGRFDSVFLIKASILLEDIVIKPKWKENKILSITFVNNKNKCKFKILDSIQMLNASLDNLSISFDINHKKSIFPHRFVNRNTLFYNGETPDFHYFKNMKLDFYNKMKSSNWDLKHESLKYLENDVKGLLEIMIKFNEKIYNLYNLNITNFVTAPKLAAAIFTSKFYNYKESKDLNIKMIKGNVEKEIRSAYYGGNVNVLINKMEHGYYYDMNSQYPFAMLNDLPVGNPTFSNDKNLDNYFGFVYGEITAPDESRLRVPYIQLRDEKTDDIYCPRGTFTRFIFSEEIKEAIKDGYSMKIIYGYKFERGKNLFKDYIDTFYNIKKSTKDPVERALSKLMLNSLYGKFGMKEIISNMKIMDKNEANKITKNYNYTIFSDLSEDKVLIKYSSKLPDSLTSLIKDKKDQMNENPLATVSRKRGVPSAVQISAAISAYARIAINKYKNIPGNPCIMSDTDSVVLPKKLSPSLIGIDLGQMKLEHEIEEGIFIRKKLYALKTIDNKEIIKSSGVNPNTLNYDKFKLLLAGDSVKCDGLSFQVLWKELNINIINKSIILKGLSGNIIDIKDHYDINFKHIIPYSPPIYVNNYRKNIDNIEIPYVNKRYIINIRFILKRLYQYIYKIIKHFCYNFLYKR